MRFVLASAAWILMAGCTAEAETEQPSQAASGVEKAAPAAAVKASSDGPFGFELGGSVEAVRGFTEIKPGLYVTKSPPKPHPEFEEVAINAYPEAGICEVRGIGVTNENDGNGATVRSKVENLAAALATKYGKPEPIDGCSAGEIGCSSQFWMMTMSQGERVHGVKWTKPNEVARKNKIGEIYLVAQAADIQSSYVKLMYRLADDAACDAAEKKLAAEGL